MTARHRLIAASRKLRELGSIGSALASTSHPYMAHIVPMRRCNLACTYCNEFDDVSDPVPIDEMRRRIDHLGRLGTSVITISGGEPLLHPELDDVIRQIRKTGAIAGMITNGYFLMPDRIERLNKAGLDHMQISIDNVMPDDVSKKSLKVLDAKLRMLAEHADFHVNINSVVGGGTANPEDALTISKRALALGFSSTIGIIHDGSGQLKPLGERERTVWDEVRRLTRRSYSRFNGFQEAIANGEPNDWRCYRAGLALPVRRRERHRQLLFAAARLPRHPHRRLHHGDRQARVPDGEVLRAELHDLVRPPGQLHRPLARAAAHDHHPRRRGAWRSWTRADSVSASSDSKCPINVHSPIS